MTLTSITQDDIGKDVVTADGEKIGIISGIEDDTVFVEPEPGIADRITAKLGWEAIDEDDYRLTEDQIDAVTDDAVRLRLLD